MKHTTGDAACLLTTIFFYSRMQPDNLSHPAAATAALLPQFQTDSEISDRATRMLDAMATNPDGHMPFDMFSEHLHMVSSVLEDREFVVMLQEFYTDEQQPASPSASPAQPLDRAEVSYALRNAGP